MKKIIPLILILFLLAMALFGFVKKNKDKIIVPEINIATEVDYTNLDDSYEEGNTENSGGASTIYVENIGLINEYLDLDMMLKYKDMVTNCGVIFPSLITNDMEDYYGKNNALINEVYGVYSLSKFVELCSYLDKATISINDKLSFANIKEIKQEGNLLKADISYFYDDKEVNIPHYISYVFIKDKPELYVYH